MRTKNSCITPEIIAAICERMAQGRSLNSICKDDDMPSRAWVYVALRDNPEFADKYAQAAEIRAEKIFDEIIEIADDGARDYGLDDDGRQIVNQDHIQRSRLRVDARKWALAKMMPRKYGDRLTHDGDAQNPIAHTVAADPKTLARAMLFLVAKSEADNAT